MNTARLHIEYSIHEYIFSPMWRVGASTEIMKIAFFAPWFKTPKPPGFIFRIRIYTGPRGDRRGVAVNIFKPEPSRAS